MSADARMIAVQLASSRVIRGVLISRHANNFATVSWGGRLVRGKELTNAEIAAQEQQEQGV